MNILCIASILPVPGIYPENDAIVRLYQHYRKINPEDNVRIWRPSAFSNVLLAKLSPKWDMYYQVLKKGDFSYDGIDVKILPFLDKKANSYNQTLLSKSVWWLNKGKIKKEIQTFQPDIIHANWLFPDGWLAMKLSKAFGIPYVLTLRKETTFYDDPASRALALEVTNNASFVTLLNIRMKNKLRETGFSGKTELIPHGVEDIFFTQQAKPDINRAAGPSVLTISRFLDWKFLDRLIEAISLVSKKHQFTYTLVGSGPEEENIKSLVSSLNLQDIVTINSPIPYEEVPTLLAQHDVFALTSYPETFGRVYFEAMAAGLPVICSQNSGVDGFFENGEAGYFADHQSVNDIAEKLEILIKNPELRKQAGLTGRKIVLQYKWPEIVKKYSTLFENYS